MSSFFTFSDTVFRSGRNPYGTLWLTIEEFQHPLLNLQANIERWRNKMRHREKLKLEQDLVEKEHEQQRIPLQQLKKGRKEESEKSRTEV